ncbi:DUF4231 domain-containing protein [Methanoculleus chikugoensis]|nr:DUF4231 domain-containing protein [Methanoculleus chikugoensis]
MERLEAQIQWYSRKSQHSQKWYKRLKIMAIIAAAAIPVFAAISVPASLIGGLGALIVILEGIQGMNQYQHNWITYRSTAEALKHEKYLFLGNAGPYQDTAKPLPLLADRVEALISREHAQWIAQLGTEGREKRGEE